ncbi:MAG: glycosyltransferase family 39 protein [Anaerolineae bacterium]|nr:glycosyltransferase family 39 protein [Anaerolineae bacterium]
MSKTSPHYLKNQYTWLLWLLIGVVVVIPRILDLDVFYARDELAVWPWADEFALAVWQGNPAGTLTESDYPGIPLFWAQTLFLTLKYNVPALFPHTGLPLENLFDGRTLDLLAERRLVVGLFVSGQILAAVWLARRLFGWTVALLAVVFLGLDPFSLTEARVLRLEMISDQFVFLSLLTYFLYLRERRWGWILLSGVMAGLGVSSKTAAGLVAPYIWLLLLLEFVFARRARPEKLKRVVVNGLIWAGGAIGIFWLIWPAMWVKPLAALNYIFGLGLSQAAEESVWHGDVFFWGRLVPNDPGPFFYPVVLAFRTMPLTWLGVVAALLLLGLLMFYPQGSYARFPLSSPAGPRLGRLSWPGMALVLLLTFIILLLLEMTLVISKVDRFLLLIFPAVGMLSALGLAAFFEWLANGAARLWAKRRGQGVGQGVGQGGKSPIVASGVLAGLIVITLGFQLGQTLPVHPYYYTYWNPWLGGGRAAMNMVPVGSGEGLDQVVNYLNQQPEAAETSLVCGASQPWCKWLFKGESLRYASYFDGSWLKADYASLYISHLQRQIYPPEVVDFLLWQKPLRQVDLQGATYAWLYRVPEIEHWAGPFNDLAGLGRLLGYNLSPGVEGGAGGPVGETITATVWWTNLGAGVDHLVLRWLDETGYEWGRARVRPLPEYASLPPEQRAIVVGTAMLTIPPTTPPGTYFLRVSVVAPDEQELLGDFALPATADQLIVTPGQILTNPARLAPANPVHEALSQEITLLGFTPPEQVLNAASPAWLTLYWQATTPPPDYWVNLRLLAGTGKEVAHWQGRPGYGRYPTSQWQSGEIVKDVWALQVEPDIPLGSYGLELSLAHPDGTLPAPSYGLLSNLEVWPQPITYDLPDMQATLNVNFGRRLTLLGYDLYFDTDGAGRGSLAPTFYWQSRAEGQESFDLLLTLRQAETNQTLKQWSAPLGGEFPKTLWKAGEVVTTLYQFNVGAMTGGSYHLDIALKNMATRQVEPVKLTNGSETNFVRIENIQDKIVIRVIK